MIPANTFTPVPVISNFLSPYDQPYQPLLQNVMGGLAIGDASLGRQVKIWTVAYTGTDITVKPIDGPIAFTLPALDVQSVSLAFDSNMALVIGWMTSVDAEIYYYDTLLAAYTTRTFIGPTSCRVVVDDARDFYTPQSDVIFSYTMAGNLYWRQQRDRYNIERLVGPTTKLLRKMAPNIENRLQFQLL
jgi:hypothetical protein